MSFFKKMTKEFEDLKTSFSKDDDKKASSGDKGHIGDHEQKHDVVHQPGQQPPYGGQASYGQPPPQSYPQSYAPPSSTPNQDALPPGWIKQWDSASQRFFYVDQSTGKTQWEPPTFSAHPPPSAPGGYAPPSGAHDAPRGEASGYYSGAGHSPMPPGAPPSGNPYGQQLHPEQGDKAKKEKDKGKGGMMAGAAGGLAVGAVGGALVGHAMGDDSDEERRYAAAPPQQAAYPHGGYAEPAYSQPAPNYGEPAPLPDETASGGSVSSSDREDVEEAREEYEEEVEEAYGSD
ncbi:MAG: hypothetical protein M1817_003347 [Caeruleum heppii]|nr:MAG: hypothetical protein M1817_003347 [Caeruleum heppii]